ncbi:MAG: Ppx/GppA family phosphatase [Deltaproteobacteria bacterium]|nr:Ppx/GppA family phosphatase [Deltaproteobacteria bacterium]
MPVFAALDIGTNTVTLVVAERAPDGSFRPLAERAEITRLGKGVDASGVLKPENIARTTDVVGTFVDEARKLGARQIACVATSAARDAKNGAEFFRAVEQRAQLRPEVISGDEEAQLGYLAAERDFGPGAKVVVDIGGGSTEFVFGQAGRVTFRKSFDVGSVRLTERHVKHDPPTNAEREAIRDALDHAFSALPDRALEAEVVGVAGTATTVYAVERAVEPFDVGRIHGQTLSRAEVESCAERLWSLRVDDRKRLPGMVAARADVIATGATILARALAKLGAAAVRISDRGVRWGLLYARFGEAA